MSQNLEIERKFLIEKCQIPEKYIINKMDIVQIYLNSLFINCQECIHSIASDFDNLVRIFITE